MPGNPILDIPVIASYKDYWNGINPDEVKDPVQLLQLRFRDLADAQRLWINVSSGQIKELADKMREANELAQNVNSEIGKLKDATTNGTLISSTSEADVSAYAERLVAAGAIKADYSPLTRSPPTDPPPRLYGVKEALGKVAENLQLQVTNYNGLSQQLQLVFTNVNNRYSESMSFISAGTDKESKQEQAIISGYSG